MAGEATFSPSINPSLPFEDARDPRVLASEFGDGYIERASDGINSDRAILSLSWENVTTAECDEIFDFFATRKGVTAFIWTPPDQATAKKWVAKPYKKSKNAAGVWAVTTTFTEVFDL
jgi:phage-related protein